MASKSSKAKLRGARMKDLSGEEVKKRFVAKSSSAALTMNRENVYATPMHKARITKVYSVSFPVCTV